MYIDGDSLVIKAVLETPDFWDAEYGDVIECESDEITIIINHSNGITNTLEGSSKVDYSNGLSLGGDVLSCLLNSNSFSNDFKKMAVTVIDRTDDFFSNVDNHELFDFAFMANRYPFFSKEQLEKIIHSENASNVYSIIRKIAYNDNEATIVQKLQKECGVKFSKNVVKRFVENPASVYDIMLFGELFSNIDLLNRFIDSGLSSVIGSCSPYFVSRIISIKGEVNAMNFFIKALSDFKLVEDASSFYVSLMAHHMNLLTDDVMKGTPAEVHDKLSAVRQSVVHPDRKIYYSEEERTRYCRTVDGIDFVLPNTTHDLIRIGQSLHNCVANYAEKADAKVCTIIAMLENDNIVGCIEVNAEGTHIVQARGFCNDLLCGYHLIAFNKYVKLAGLSTVGCSDLTPAQLAGVAEEDAYNLDFHEVEFDERGNIVEL